MTALYEPASAAELAPSQPPRRRRDARGHSMQATPPVRPSVAGASPIPSSTSVPAPTRRRERRATVANATLPVAMPAVAPQAAPVAQCPDEPIPSDGTDSGQTTFIAGGVAPVLVATATMTHVVPAVPPNVSGNISPDAPSNLPGHRPTQGVAPARGAWPAETAASCPLASTGTLVRPVATSGRVPQIARPSTSATFTAPDAPTIISRRMVCDTATSQRKLLPAVSGAQLSVAGFLGLVTIASPLSGAWASASVRDAGSAHLATAMNAGSVFSTGSASSAAGVSAVRVVTPSGLSSQDASVAALPVQQVLVAKPSRDNERSILPGCDGDFDEEVYEKAGNGNLPKSTLCTLWQPDRQLRADAAVALAKLNFAYKAQFGHDLALSSDYRTYGEQAALYRKYGAGRAARPGRSTHGLGLAVDLQGVKSYSNSTYRWLRENAAAYGWENPDWAVQGGSGVDEPWHWEYFPGTRNATDQDFFG